MIDCPGLDNSLIRRYEPRGGGLIQNKYVYFQTLFSYPKYNKVFLQLTLKILVNQENSKSNKIIKMTRAFHPYLTFTGEPPGSQPNLPLGSQPNLPKVLDLLPQVLDPLPPGSRPIAPRFSTHCPQVLNPLPAGSRPIGPRLTLMSHVNH